MSKTIEEYVIDEIKRRRIKLGISQAALADYINVSRGFIGAVENPKQRAKYNLQLINEIVKVLNCSPRDLLPLEPLE
ncbi:MAG: helix-turn-helix transcriptional regulator [Parabacteroides sp.]|nr:helix-turn-helix transcriptional regulator [Parabacteroides sp.]